MNEESELPFIEPELEVRIVSLVLGEASDFETEELNRLIDMRPELAAFQLRMQRVHGLLQDVGEGEFAAPSEDWKLPADQRNAVLAVIRGETTVARATLDVNQSAQLAVSARRSLLRNLTHMAAFACVLGFIGMVTWSAFFPGESASSSYFSEVASVEVTHDQNLVSGGSIPLYDIDAEADFAEGLKRRSSVIDLDSRKGSEVALSAIQDTLTANSALPSPVHLADDLQLESGYSTFTVREEARVPQKVRSLETTDRATTLVDKAPEPAAPDSDVSEFIAGNGNGWAFRELRGEEHDVNGRDPSEQSAAPADEGDLTFPSAVDDFGKVADPAVAAIQFNAPNAAVDGLDRQLMVENKLGSRNAIPWSTEAPDVNGADFRESRQGIDSQNSELSLAVVDSPEAMPEKHFDFNIQDLANQSSVSEQQQTRGWSRNFGDADAVLSKKRVASQVDRPTADDEQSGMETLRVENERPGVTTEPALVAADDRGRGGAVDHPADNETLLSRKAFEQGGERQQGLRGGESAAGFGSSGVGGGGLDPAGLNQASNEDSKRIPADAFGIEEYEMKGVAGGVDGLEKYSRSEIRGKVDALESGAYGEPPDVAGFHSGLSSAPETPADPAVAAKEFGRFGKSSGPDGDREKLQELSEAMPSWGGVAADREQAQSHFESFGVRPQATTAGTVVRTESSQPVGNDVVGRGLYGGGIEARPKDQRFEAQRKLDAAGLDVKGRFMKRPVERLMVAHSGLDEKTAAIEAFSTFSLHVSDVSFKLAFAALGRGEWPDAARVRIEEFVNAFDYGDPLPRHGEKVACCVEQSIHPFVQQRNLLRVSMRTAAAGRSSSTPLRLTFLLDNSGSMERVDRRQTVRRAFALLAEQLTPIDQVTLISFARQPRLLADRVTGADAGKLVRLIDRLPSEGGTNIEAALQLAFEKAREQQTPAAQNRIILLTDGAVNLGNANPESLSHMVTTMRKAGIAFDAAGISADGLNDEVLEALTRKGDGRYYLLDSVESAADGFARQIAGALRPSAKNVKVQVEFNPKRVGRYKLLGFEKHILNREDFRNDKVDAAEMAAAEAGVAMYQFEALPDGEGDVGSVSVRFLDLSTGQMIENRWPIPYESGAPPIDQADPSLRIAASAAMLAAKLRGEPLGEFVDLQALSQLMSGLSVQDRDDKRVQQLQQMIGQARQLSTK